MLRAELEVRIEKKKKKEDCYFWSSDNWVMGAVF